MSKEETAVSSSGCGRASLKDILSDKSLCQAFVQFLIQEKNEENYYFWRDAEDFIKLSNGVKADLEEELKLKVSDV
jgi:hypothetical protein